MAPLRDRVGCIDGHPATNVTLLPQLHPDFPFDLEAPGSRFTRRPGVAIARGEVEDDEAAERVIREEFGDWVLDDDLSELGRADAVASSFGRGAAAWGAAAEFVAIHVAGGVISSAAGLAFKAVVDRVRERLRQRHGSDEPLAVSRGAAALLAGAEVATRFGVEGELEVEAVEEPSSIAGETVMETSYVGFEPWVVLLRTLEHERRFIVVIQPNGAPAAAIELQTSEAERLRAMVPLDRTTWANPPRPR